MYATWADNLNNKFVLLLSKKENHNLHVPWWISVEEQSICGTENILQKKINNIKCISEETLWIFNASDLTTDWYIL